LQCVHNVPDLNKKSSHILGGGRFANYNVAVTNQPHSEIAALSVFLDHLQRGQELKADFEGKMKIIGNMSNKVGVKRSEQIN